jgi:hypothetical protein
MTVHHDNKQYEMIALCATCQGCAVLWASWARCYVVQAVDCGLLLPHAASAARIWSRDRRHRNTAQKRGKACCKRAGGSFLAGAGAAHRRPCWTASWTVRTVDVAPPSTQSDERTDARLERTIYKHHLHLVMGRIL